jgi:hypothetical protein
MNKDDGRECYDPLEIEYLKRLEAESKAQEILMTGLFAGLRCLEKRPAPISFDNDEWPGDEDLI